MSFSVVLRRAAAGAARAAHGFFSQGPRSLHLSPLRPLIMGGLPPRVELSDLAVARFSSSPQKKPPIDAELLRIVESEIACAKEECGEVEVPKGFPFDIQDEEGTSAVTLKRDYLGETIEVVASMPTVEEPDVDEEVDDEKNHGDDEENHADDEKAVQPSFSMTVNISKGEEAPSIEFRCTAYTDDIVIDSLFIRRDKDSDDLLAYEGPDFEDLDENLQKAFHKYLEARGISPATTSFLYEYLVNKDDREYLLWLQNVKNFLQK